MPTFTQGVRHRRAPGPWGDGMMRGQGRSRAGVHRRRPLRDLAHIVVAGTLILALQAGIGDVARSASASPTFVQQASSRGPNRVTGTVTLPSNITTGNRLIVETGVWNYSSATISAVTDSAGNTYS